MPQHALMLQNSLEYVWRPGRLVLPGPPGWLVHWLHRFPDLLTGVRGKDEEDSRQDTRTGEDKGENRLGSV